jgi:hypothetical protein
MPKGENLKGKKHPLAGTKKGTLHKKTLLKEEAEKQAQQIRIDNLTKITQAQLDLALGRTLVFLVEHYEDDNGELKTRDILMTDSTTIEEALKNPTQMIGSNYYKIIKEKPDIVAIKDLVDRLSGRPANIIAGDKTNPININTKMQIEFINAREN